MANVFASSQLSTLSHFLTQKTTKNNTGAKYDDGEWEKYGYKVTCSARDRTGDALHCAEAELKPSELRPSSNYS